MNCLWQANGDFVCDQPKKNSNKKVIEGFSVNSANDYWQNSSDYPGNNIDSQNVTNADQCKSICVNDSRCVGTVYTDNGEDKQSMCELKGTLNPTSKISNTSKNTWFKIDGNFKQSCKNCQIPSSIDGNTDTMSCQCPTSTGWNLQATLSLPSCVNTTNINNDNGNLTC